MRGKRGKYREINRLLLSCLRNPDCNYPISNPSEISAEYSDKAESVLDEDFVSPTLPPFLQFVTSFLTKVPYQIEHFESLDGTHCSSQTHRTMYQGPIFRKPRGRMRREETNPRRLGNGNPVSK